MTLCDGRIIIEVIDNSQIKLIVRGVKKRQVRINLLERGIGAIWNYLAGGIRFLFCK